MEADAVLVAGRGRPGLGLDAAGVDTNKLGQVKVDMRSRTTSSAPNVYAL